MIVRTGQLQDTTVISHLKDQLLYACIVRSLDRPHIVRGLGVECEMGWFCLARACGVVVQ